jgi:hypothetical protein
MTWIDNTGVKPDAKRVDLKFGCDEEDMPGVPCISHNSAPEDWDWSVGLPYDERILQYRECK